MMGLHSYAGQAGPTRTYTYIHSAILQRTHGGLAPSGGRRVWWPQIWTFAPERRWNQALRFANFTVLGMAFTGSVGPFWLLVQASQSSLRYALPQPAPSDWRKKQSCAP